jgi:hypothetical protein
MRGAQDRLVYTEKGWKSILTGLLLVAFGAACFWLARLRPGEENGWVPYVDVGRPGRGGVEPVVVLLGPAMPHPPVDGRRQTMG